MKDLMFIFLLMIFCTAFGHEWEPSSNFKFEEGIYIIYTVAAIFTVIMMICAWILYRKLRRLIKEIENIHNQIKNS